MTRIKSKRTPREELIIDLAHAFAKYGVYASCDSITACVREHAFPIIKMMENLEFAYDSNPNMKYKEFINIIKWTNP